MGLDPSINSTGICIWNTLMDTHKYYLIMSHAPKKMLLMQCDNFKILEYPHQGWKNIKLSPEKEHIKFENIIRICEYIKQIISETGPDMVNIESIAFSANGILDQLAGLNYMIRYIMYQNGIPTNAIPPASVKLAATGKGNSGKDIMIQFWKVVQPQFEKLNGKIDDLADAYFLAHYII